jgi:amino acid transporter
MAVEPIPSAPAWTAGVPSEVGPPQADLELQREFSLRTAFSLAFAFISPIVALYTIFAQGIAASGPGFWFGFPAALAGQLLVALAFGMLASRYPLEGSVYQWSRVQVGERYGWFAGWTYVWTLLIAMAAVAQGGANFLAQLLGPNPADPAGAAALALGVLALGTWGNSRGRRVLAAMVWLCVLAEIVGSVGVGTWLLCFGRVNVPSVLLAGPGFFPSGSGWDALFTSRAATAVAICGWAFVGFESAGSIAEEVRQPERNVPRAIVGSLLFVAAIVSYSAFALLLAVPRLDEAVAGRSADPVIETLVFHFGPLVSRVLMAFFVIGFLACLLGIQTSVSRVLWAFARDGELPGARRLRELSGADRVPVNAIATSGAIAALILFLSFTHWYSVLVDFTTAGFYLAFAFPCLAAAWAIVRGRWPSTPFHLGALSKPVVLLAAAWTIFEVVNIAWPRASGAPWYETWAVCLMVLLLGALGVAVRASLDRNRPDRT